MPYAAGYEGFSAASKQKRTRIICTLGPASWCAAAYESSNLCARTQRRAGRAGQPLRPQAHAIAATDSTHTRTHAAATAGAATDAASQVRRDVRGLT